MPEQLFLYQLLYNFTRDIFQKLGCPANDAAVAATALLSADLRGIDSHGVARLGGYVRLWEAKRINATPHMHVVHETPSTAVVDGDRGLGLVVAPYSMNLAIEKAKHAGTGWVSVRNSNHFGIAAHHAMLALQHDMIGIALTNASPLVAPTFAAERLLGTNPICVTIPAGQQPPFIADMATTTATSGRLELLQRKNGVAPVGWLQDSKGHYSTNPHELKAGGALLPLGGDREHGSHKGYALGAIVDILSAVLSGANYGPWVPPFPAFMPMPEEQPGKGVGHFFGAIRIDAFRPASEFKENMDKWINRFRSAKPMEGHAKVLIPGDPERETEELRMERGIPLLPSVVEELKFLSEKFSILFPEH